MVDKVYIVTGTSAGIGVGIAECLAKSGVRKLVLVARRKELLDEVAASCKKLGATDVLVLSKDLSDAASCSQIVSETVAKFGRVDVLVNNAAIGDMSQTKVADVDLDVVQKLMAVNFMAPLILTQAALSHIRKVKGNIVFINSGTAHHPVPWCGSYAASKSAMATLAKTLAMEEAAAGVRINVITPGVIKSQMTLPWVSSMGDPDEVLKKCQMLPVAGLPEYIGKAVVFVTSDATAEFMTGSDLVVDGGSLLNPFHVLGALGVQ